jgi:hypothetical protein
MVGKPKVTRLLPVYPPSDPLRKLASDKPMDQDWIVPASLSSYAPPHFEAAENGCVAVFW